MYCLQLPAHSPYQQEMFNYTFYMNEYRTLEEVRAFVRKKHMEEWQYEDYDGRYADVLDSLSCLTELPELPEYIMERSISFTHPTFGNVYLVYSRIRTLD